MTTIGDRLRSLRDAKGVSQEVAAEACNMTRVALARYETGARVPKTQYVKKLAEYYGVTIDYLMGGEDTQAPLLAADLGDGETKAAPRSIDDQIMQELAGADLDLCKEVLSFIRFKKQGG